MENYLIKETNFKTRQLITKFRVSDHNLEVEIGRYKNIPREQRTCKICTKDIDDEYHFFLNCSINSNLRINLFNNIQQNNSDFLRYKPLDKLIYILNPKSELLPALGDFIKQSTELRK